jgi:hypothetical protein
LVRPPATIIVDDTVVLEHHLGLAIAAGDELRGRAAPFVGVLLPIDLGESLDLAMMQSVLQTLCRGIAQVADLIIAAYTPFAVADGIAFAVGKV